MSGRAWAIGRYEVEAEAVHRRAAGNDKLGYSVDVQPTYFISDAFNVYVGLELGRMPDWLVWQQDNLIGSFDRREAASQCRLQLADHQPAGTAPAAPGDRPECATLRQGYRIDAAGNAVAQR